jgi:hypothetical protein
MDRSESRLWEGSPRHNARMGALDQRRLRRRIAVSGLGILLILGALPLYPTQGVAVVAATVLLISVAALSWFSRSVIHWDDQTSDHRRQRWDEQEDWNDRRVTYLLMEDMSEAKKRRDSVGADWSHDIVRDELHRSVIGGVVPRGLIDDGALQEPLEALTSASWQWSLAPSDESGSRVLRATRELRRAAGDRNRLPDDALVDRIRTIGPAVIGLAFVVFWTALYLLLWGVDGDSFSGLGTSPRAGGFLYLAVSGLVGATPSGVSFHTPVAEMAGSAELLTALVTVGLFAHALHDTAAPSATSLTAPATPVMEEPSRPHSGR